jgi:hypothetical protein
MRRRTLFWFPLLLGWSETAPAQETQSSFCYRARPKPACSTFAFTNFGTYLVLGSDIKSGDTPVRAVADWGVMANVDSRNAIGASVFASLDRLGFGVGPAVHYRRWLSSTASVDVAVGAPLLAATDDIQSGSVFGLVRWSPNHWFALAARPELVRGPVFLGCGPSGCDTPVRSRMRMSLGMELGWVPGLTLTAASGIATAFIAALLSGVD